MIKAPNDISDLKQTAKCDVEPQKWIAMLSQLNVKIFSVFKFLNIFKY